VTSAEWRWKVPFWSSLSDPTGTSMNKCKSTTVKVCLFLIWNESLKKWIKLVARNFSPNGKKNNELIHLGWAFRVCLTRSSCKVRE
jgi:hypothetical protein